MERRRPYLERPELLGLVFALFALLAVVFGPASNTRFIYTAF
jgi:hypothetical protein